MSNIYKVINEDHLFEILENNKLKLVMVSFTSKENDVGNKIKKCFIELAKENRDSMFAYIDVKQYNNNGKITIDGLATTEIFLNNKQVFLIQGNDVNLITKTFSKAKQLLANIQKPVQQPVAPPKNPVSVQPKEPIKELPPNLIEQPPQMTSVPINMPMQNQMNMPQQYQFTPQQLYQMQQMQQMRQLQQMQELQKLQHTQRMAQNQQKHGLSQVNQPVSQQKKAREINDIINKLDAIQKTKETEEKIIDS